MASSLTAKEFRERLCAGVTRSDFIVNLVLPPILLLISCAYLFWGFLNGSWFGFTIIIVVDLYLAALLLLAALQIHYLLPQRQVALVMVPTLFLVLVMAFAQLYVKSGEIKRTTLGSPSVVETLNNPWDAAYFSLVTMATVGFGDYTPQETGARMIAVVQILSGVLLLLFAIPLLASRLATFDEPTGTTTVIKVRRLDEGSWTVQENDGKAEPHEKSKGLTITVKAQGTITDIVKTND